MSPQTESTGQPHLQKVEQEGFLFFEKLSEGGVEVRRIGCTNEPNDIARAFFAYMGQFTVIDNTVQNVNDGENRYSITSWTNLGHSWMNLKEFARSFQYGDFHLTNVETDDRVWIRYKQTDDGVRQLDFDALEEDIEERIHLLSLS